MSDNWIPILAFAALVLLVLVRRALRLLTRQRFSRVRLVLRLGLIGLVSALLFVPLSLTRGFVPAAGLAVGGLLGLLGAALTHFEVEGGRIDYVPNRWLGTGVLTLFVGRILYRWTVLSTTPGVTPPSGAEPLAALRQMSSPWTVAILFVLLGYYLCFYTAVLIRGSSSQVESSTSSPGRRRPFKTTALTQVRPGASSKPAEPSAGFFVHDLQGISP